MSYTLLFENKRETKELESEKTIQELLNEMDISSETLVIKKNGEIVEEETKIENGDEIQLIQIIYGG
jgi:sulfur carrier protein